MPKLLARVQKLNTMQRLSRAIYEFGHMPPMGGMTPMMWLAIGTLVLMITLYAMFVLAYVNLDIRCGAACGMLIGGLP